MADIGYNDNVNVLDRTFHVQTASNINKGLARCEVFEEGRLIRSYQVDFERRRVQDEEGLEKRIREIVSALHKDTMNEIELLFQIGDKVKKLKHAPSNIKLGLIFLKNNLVEDAVEQFETALSIDAESIEALNHLGQAYIQMGKNTKAIHLLKQASKNGNSYADVFHNLGLAYLNEKQHYKALVSFQEALRINPRYLKAVYNLAIVYLESVMVDKGDTLLPPPSIRLERALQQLKKLEGMKNKLYTNLYPVLTRAIANSEIDTAIKMLIENRDKIFPTDISSLIGMDFYLKFMYGGRGLNNEAIQRFEQNLHDAIENNPNYPDLWNNLGIVHLIQCRNLFLQALSEFDKALEINPSFEKAIKNKKLVENDGKEFLILLRAILR